MSEINEKDVLKIARDLNFELTKEEIGKVIKTYDEAKEDYMDCPDDNWSYIVENIIYNMKS